MPTGLPIYGILISTITDKPSPEQLKSRAGSCGRNLRIVDAGKNQSLAQPEGRATLANGEDRSGRSEQNLKAFIASDESPHRFSSSFREVGFCIVSACSNPRSLDGNFRDFHRCFSRQLFVSRSPIEASQAPVWPWRRGIPSRKPNETPRAQNDKPSSNRSGNFESNAERNPLQRQRSFLRRVETICTIERANSVECHEPH